MKTFFYKFVVVLLLVSTQMKAQDRNIIWTHGLGGNASHWEHYDNIFENERQTNGVRFSYQTTTGISNATNNVRSNINGSLNYLQLIDNRNLLIGHSLGGVVARNLDKNYTGSNKRIGGYITVNSPLYGAPIVEAINNGSVNSWASDACLKMGLGPTAQLFGPLNGFLTVPLCDMLLPENFADEFIKAGQTRDDLLPNSQVLNDINSFPSNLPRISLWGEETSPTHWRLLSSSGFKINDKYYFGNNDYDLPILMSQIRQIYNFYYSYNLAISIGCAVGGFWFPGCWWATAYYGYLAHQWNLGKNWIDNSENQWNALIKTSRPELGTFLYADFSSCNLSDYYWGICDPNYYEVTQWVSVNYPSDGLLPQYTQVIENNTTPNGTYRILGANHMEVLDMSNSYVNGQLNDGTRQRFNEIFNRDTNDWFNTPVRP